MVEEEQVKAEQVKAEQVKAKEQLDKLCKKFHKAICTQDHDLKLSTKETIKLLYQAGVYPYPKRMDCDEYEAELVALQIELVKLQAYLQHEGKRLIVICEGRDAAGKGGAISRFTQYLNPRHARVVALPKPTDREYTQWYFQRYINHFPAAGEMVFFDRSWYNRAGVERVMGFCSESELADFYQQAPALENMLVESDIILIKFWFTVEKLEQSRRFHERMKSPLKQWKLSPMDVESLGKWDDYTRARNDMFQFTDKKTSPWVSVNSNDKRRARVNSIRYLLQQFDYPDKDIHLVNKIDKKVIECVYNLMK